MFKNRKKDLIIRLERDINKKNIDIREILLSIDYYEKDNLDTITKLRKEKKVEMTKINGAISQSINAHGAITKTLIPSCSKRIYGALMVNPNTKDKITPISIRDIIIGFTVGLIISFYLFG